MECRDGWFYEMTTDCEGTVKIRDIFEETLPMCDRHYEHHLSVARVREEKGVLTDDALNMSEEDLRLALRTEIEVLQEEIAAIKKEIETLKAVR